MGVSWTSHLEACPSQRGLANVDPRGIRKDFALHARHDDTQALEDATSRPPRVALHCLADVHVKVRHRGNVVLEDAVLNCFQARNPSDVNDIAMPF